MNKQFDEIKQKIENGKFSDELPVLVRIYTTEILNILLESSKENFQNVKEFLCLNKTIFTHHIINRELLKEREDLIDLIKMIKMKTNENKDLEKEVIKSIKTGNKKSPGLATLLTSTTTRFT